MPSGNEPDAGIRQPGHNCRPQSRSASLRLLIAVLITSRRHVLIADLQHTLSMNNNSSTFGDYYNALVSEVGADLQTADAYFSHQSAMVLQLENRRESISGVSLDEEMINLVKFQTAYDAAAKLITTADELLQTVINMV